MAENWAGLAEAIGMVWVETGWLPDEGAPYAEGISADRLPAYLMEPAQTARILALTGLPLEMPMLMPLAHGDPERLWVVELAGHWPVVCGEGPTPADAIIALAERIEGEAHVQS